jgi:hypothetical protein
MEFRREEALDMMNERYLECGAGECVDVGDLVAAKSWAQVALTLNPELLGVYKESVNRAAYYRMARKVRERRAQAIPVDLRVPADAWLDSAA